MQNNSDAIREAMKMANTPAGQQLLNLLKQSGGAELDRAMHQAASGDFQAAKALLGSLMKDPQAQELMKKMGGSHGTAGR